MKSQLFVGLVLILSVANASAQLNDDEIKSRVRFYADKLGIELHGPGIATESSVQSFRRVYFGQLSCSIRKTDGTLVVLWVGQQVEQADLGAEDFGDDEAAWSLAEGILRTLELDEGRFRGKIIWEDAKGPVGVNECPYVSCSFVPKPYGYKVAGGNSVEIAFRRRDGALFRVSSGTPFTYERPNIQITEEQAKAVAIREYGGEPGDWHVSEPFYTTGVNPYVSDEIRRMAENRVMRLCLSVGSPFGKVTVDTVKGTLVYKAAPPLAIPTKPKLPKPAVAAQTTPDVAVTPTPSRLPLILGSIAGILAFGYFYTWLRKRQ
ncbi:MAG: hypothetical protein ABL949_05245 [Fimbriimonadaceae bacterium]